jgi:hypothetical protein
VGRTLGANRVLAGSACGKRRRVRPLNSVVRHHLNQLRGAIGLLTALAAGPSLGQDVVRITFHSGYPMPGTSVENVLVEVRRHTSKPERPSEVDRYFEGVRKALDDARAVERWTPPIPLHTPMVKVDITLGPRRYILEAPWSERGPEMAINPAEVDRRHFAALETILASSVDYLSTRWPKGK